MLCQVCTLRSAAAFSFAWWDADIFASSPSTKDHLIKRPSPVLNKTFCCLSAVSLSYLCSSAPYFRFVLLCWFCFLTQTSRLKNGPAVTSCKEADLLRQQGSFRAAGKQMKLISLYILSLKEITERGGQTHHPCFLLGSPHLSVLTNKLYSQCPVLDWCRRQVFTSGLTQQMAQMWAGTPQSHRFTLVLQVLPSATAPPGLSGHAPWFTLAHSALQWLSHGLREKSLLPAPGGCCQCPRDLAPVPTLALVPTEQRQHSSLSRSGTQAPTQLVPAENITKRSWESMRVDGRAGLQTKGR